MASSVPGPSTPASPSSSGLDVARLLVQRVSRAFYGSKGAILVDQLIQKEAYRDEELGKRLGMPSRDVSKIAHRLVTDQLVQVHRRSELKPGAPKASLRTYFYLDFSKSVDVIKWRMWKVQQTIDVKLRNELDAQGYSCPLCKATYTPLDAASLYDPMRNLLACSICQTEVTNSENDEEVKGNKDRMQRLNRQTKGIVDLLKKLERVELPRFDIERYLAIHGPALGATAAAAAAASGQTITLAPEVKVHLAGDDDEQIEREKRELELKEKRAQNMLPSWIAQSTIEKQTNSPDGGSTSGIVAREGIQDDQAEQGIVGNVDPVGSDATSGTHGGTSGVTGLGSVDIGGFGAAMSFYEQPEEDEDQDEKPLGDGDDLDAYYASLEAANHVQPDSTDSNVNSPAQAETGTNSPFATATVANSSLGTPDTSGTLPDGDNVETIAFGNGAKRSREESLDSDPKRFKSAPRSPIAPADASPLVEATAEVGEGDDEEEFDQVEQEGEDEGDMDPDQLISVNGKMMPYSQVTEDMTSEMTADEYSAYWDVYARLNE
ncbi:uncharacterized protein JCM15063_003973 [Sporobolomyces koalae]|uniref:uncharacterized protein n=1 Tax=Sporobolomyces koalae TaxID=500713 RepID=UPI003173CE65